MTNAQHTPAPWRIRFKGGSVAKNLIIHDSTEYPSGMYGIGEVYGDDAIDNANARLIAAAPELLEALERADNELREMYQALPAHRAWIARVLDITEQALISAK